MHAVLTFNQKCCRVDLVQLGIRVQVSDHLHKVCCMLRTATGLIHFRSRFNNHASFEVERAQPPQHPPQLARSSFSEGPDSARFSDTGTAKAADGAEKSKRKGRFQIVEEDPTDPAKRGVGRSTSVASMDSHRSIQVCCPPNHSQALSMAPCLQSCLVAHSALQDMRFTNLLCIAKCALDCGKVVAKTSV